jgi:hypothetical protein
MDKGDCRFIPPSKIRANIHRFPLSPAAAVTTYAAAAVSAAVASTPAGLGGYDALDAPNGGRSSTPKSYPRELPLGVGGKTEW